MTTLTQTYGAGEPLSYDLPYYSRKEVVVLSGQNLAANTVLGRVDATASSPAAGGGNTGTGVMGAVTVADHAMPGLYTLTATAAAANGGTFNVVGPDGMSLGSATVGVAFSGGGLSFTIADGATDFIVGDTFTFTVSGNAMKAWNPANSDGSEAVAGILLDAVDATAGDLPGTAIVRHARVNPPELTFYSGATEGAKRDALAQLAALGITTR